MGYPTAHWAEDLQAGDTVEATIRHQTDGSKNRHNVRLIVVSVDAIRRNIDAWDATNNINVTVPFNELKTIVPTNYSLPAPDIERERDEKVLREFADYFLTQDIGDCNCIIPDGTILDFLQTKYKQ